MRNQRKIEWIETFSLLSPQIWQKGVPNVLRASSQRIALTVCRCTSRTSPYWTSTWIPVIDSAIQTRPRQKLLLPLKMKERKQETKRMWMKAIRNKYRSKLPNCLPSFLYCMNVFFFFSSSFKFIWFHHAPLIFGRVVIVNRDRACVMVPYLLLLLILLCHQSAWRCTCVWVCFMSH